MSGVRIAVVIPTRNRPDMAIAAIRHLCAEKESDLLIFVSDNSAGEEDVRKLADFCDAFDDPRVTYVRTPGNLPQGVHWDRSLRRALEQSDATHVTIHYDRKVIRPGSASIWFAVAGRFPDKVFTYTTDFVAAEPPPYRLWEPPWTGKLYALKTAKVAAVSAQGDAAAIGHLLPILSNCIVPRAVAETIVDRFGTLCESTTADSCFAYRFCALHDDYLHLDRTLAILYGSHRSAAVGYLSGGGGDFADYMATWRGDTWLEAATIPGLNLGYNMLFHEYELVRREIGGDRLPPLDRDGCLGDLGRGLAWIRDPGLKAELRKLLEEHGWKGEAAPEPAPPAPPPALWRRILRRLRRHLISDRTLERLRHRRALFLADRFGVAPGSFVGFEFESDEQALSYALRFPSAPVRSTGHLALADARLLDVEIA